MIHEKTIGNNHSGTSPEFQRLISFKTAKGSVYSYDESGRTTRFKTATGEQEEPQDITVFTILTPEDERVYLDAIHAMGSEIPSKVYVIERQPDDSALVVRTIPQVKDLNRLYLAIVKGGEIIKHNPASLKPTEGANVFDTRHFKEGDEWQTERHLGNKVIEINYEQ